MLWNFFSPHFSSRSYIITVCVHCWTPPVASELGAIKELCGFSEETEEEQFIPASKSEQISSSPLVSLIFSSLVTDLAYQWLLPLCYSWKCWCEYNMAFKATEKCTCVCNANNAIFEFISLLQSLRVAKIPLLTQKASVWDLCYFGMNHFFVIKTTTSCCI